MRSPIEDLSFPVLALLMVGALGWTAMPKPNPTNATEISAVTVLEDRVTSIAEAIARAEGYYAAGNHDGRSLPYRLNNPGALKKPALHAAALPTWKDTGLIEFPTSDLGWDALRHQVRLMLSGASRIYERADSLLLVGDKYADGDLKWGVNVADRLGVSPCATLADLASAETRESATAAPHLAARAAAALLARTSQP